MKIPSIILACSLSQEGENVRIDLQTLGDLRPTKWVPGQQETGPNYFGVAVIPGKLPQTISQATVDAIGEEMRKKLVGELAKQIITS